jgi:hypothetical protein
MQPRTSYPSVSGIGVVFTSACCASVVIAMLVRLTRLTDGFAA